LRKFSAGQGPILSRKSVPSGRQKRLAKIHFVGIRCAVAGISIESRFGWPRRILTIIAAEHKNQTD
jgi:hypothetical protein